MDEKQKVNEKKQNREEGIKLKLLISVLSFLAILIAEIYIIINLGSNVNSVALFAIMALIAVYFVLDSMMALSEQRNEKLEEQYEDIFNMQKAAYMGLNTSLEEMNDRVTLIEKIVKISTDEIINAQKGTSKVIINRNKENTEAILQSYIELTQQLEKFEEMQTEKLAVLDEISEKTSSDINREMELRIQKLIVQMRDMELRLNQSIMQSSKVVVSQVPMQTSETRTDRIVDKQIENVEYVKESAISNEVTSQVAFDSIKVNNNVQNADTFENISEVADFDAIDFVVPNDLDNTGVFENTTEFQNLSDLNEVQSEIVSELEQEMENIPTELDEKITGLLDTEEIFNVEPSVEQEEEAEIEIEPELLIEEPMSDVKEHDLMPELVVEEPPTDESIPADITMTEISAEKGEELSMSDMSNPNKIMSPEEIAALIANVDEPVKEEPKKEELKKEEKPPMPDMSNPNKIMSADEIAALIANVGEPVKEEPKKEEKPPMSDMSNPNKIMSAEEIAALVANASEVMQEEPKKEEKPPMPDMSNPNKIMSPEEIAALIANL